MVRPHVQKQLGVMVGSMLTGAVAAEIATPDEVRGALIQLSVLATNEDAWKLFVTSMHSVPQETVDTAVSEMNEIIRKSKS